VPDKQFPAEGKVFEEAPKPLPGLAGESRSGDANGQWFRVLAAGGLNLVTLAPGRFATTALPIIGANPPKQAKRPPLNREVPCETQAHPDLRSNPGAPPEQHMVDPTTSLFKSRYAKSREVALEWLTEQLKLEDLTKTLKLSDKDATKDLIAKVKAAGGSR
jgi:phospholipid/cholesterol/gamma-HCH transport system substrate-binding protein